MTFRFFKIFILKRIHFIKQNVIFQKIELDEDFGISVVYNLKTMLIITGAMLG